MCKFSIHLCEIQKHFCLKSAKKEKPFFLWPSLPSICAVKKHFSFNRKWINLTVGVSSHITESGWGTFLHSPLTLCSVQVEAERKELLFPIPLTPPRPQSSALMIQSYSLKCKFHRVGLHQKEVQRKSYPSKLQTLKTWELLALPVTYSQLQWQWAG